MVELQTKDKEFDEKLKVIIFDVLQKGKFNSKLFSRLNTKEIESYLKQITKDDYKRVADEIKTNQNRSFWQRIYLFKNNGANRSISKIFTSKLLDSENLCL